MTQTAKTADVVTEGVSEKSKWSLPQIKPEQSEQVFFVYREDGRNPVFRHPTYWHCRKEAERLALANPGVRFHVISTHRIIVAPVEPHPTEGPRS